MVVNRSYILFKLLAPTCSQVGFYLQTPPGLAVVVVFLTMPAFTFRMFTLAEFAHLAKLLKDSICYFFVIIFHFFIFIDNARLAGAVGAFFANMWQNPS